MKELSKPMGQPELEGYYNNVLMMYPRESLGLQMRVHFSTNTYLETVLEEPPLLSEFHLLIAIG